MKMRMTIAAVSLLVLSLGSAACDGEEKSHLPAAGGTPTQAWGTPEQQVVDLIKRQERAFNSADWYQSYMTMSPNYRAICPYETYEAYCERAHLLWLEELGPGDLALVDIDVRIDGEWAYVTGAMLHDGQVVAAPLNEPDLYRMIGGFWYDVADTPDDPGYNLADLPSGAETPVDGDGAADAIAQLPGLTVGDRWVSRTDFGYASSTVTSEVTGETSVSGKDCYVLEASYDPPMMGEIEHATAAVDKTTMMVVTMEGAREEEGVTYFLKSTFAYEFPLGLPYPYEVGKHWEVVEKETLSVTSGGATISEPETVVRTVFRVEGMERVTVAAGTFDCFVIRAYDENDILQGTSWYSETAKTEVKSIDYQSGSTMELLSCSLR